MHISPYPNNPKENSLGNKKLGIRFFNETWDLIDKTGRSREEDALMIDKAHASSLHWYLSSAFQPVNGARSQWQLSRVYALLGMSESALYHAQTSLDICKANDIRDFDLAFAYEAVARALAVQNKSEESAAYKALALRACEDIAKPEDRDYALSEINANQ